MNSVINLTVASGFQQSNIADLPNVNGFCTVVANALTSCQLFLQKEHRIFLSFLAELRPLNLKLNLLHSAFPFVLDTIACMDRDVDPLARNLYLKTLTVFEAIQTTDTA